jgi:hypothetical protein
MTTNTVMTGVSRVEYKENNQTQTPQPASTSIGAVVVWATKGEIFTPVRINNGENEVVSKFGQPNPAYGYGLYAANKFARVSPLYVIRAVAGSYSYASAVYGQNYVSSTYTTSNFGVPVYVDPKNPDDSITWNIGDPLTRSNAFLIRRIGPGFEGNNIAVSITSDNMPPSITPVSASAATESGAVLAADQYRWHVVPVNNLGRAINAIDPNATALTITSPNNLATVVFPRISGATGYEIYRQTTGSGSYYYYASVPQVAVGLSTITFIDRGQFIADTTRQLPVEDYEPTDMFTLNVFDTSVSSQNSIATYDVTFNAKIDGFGQQLGIEEKVNLLSSEIRIQRNDLFTPDPSTTNSAGDPIFYSSSLYTFTLGNDGLNASSLPDSAYIEGYNLLSNEEDYEVRIVIEAGKTLSVQRAIIDLCAQRKDCFPFLDVPPDFQTASNAVNYRANILNVNTDRAALYTPDARVYDQYTSTRVWLPPSAHAASIFANNDSNYAIYTAGAGLIYSQLTDVEELRYKYSKNELNMLANAQVNMLRGKSSTGIYLPEQLTLARQLSALSFISVRRMTDAIELTVARTSEFYLQQPNNDDLVRQIVNLITSYLDPFVPNGISRYEIVSDASNNTPAFTNNAQRNVSVYIWPVLPTRYIQLVINLTKEGVSFQELLQAA